MDIVSCIETEVKQELQKLSDEKYKKFHSNLCQNTKTPILGVRVPILRQYAKELIQTHKLEELEKIGEDYYEEVMLKGMIIGLQNKTEFNVAAKQIKKFVPKIDNWAVCDTFCAGLKITKKHKNEMFEFVKTYLNSTKEFELRFAIVMLVDYYIDDEHISEVLEIFDKVKHNGYYVKMAVAWAVSVCLMKYYDVTIEYLKKCNLDDFTYNKALQKAIESFRISDNQKEELRKLKK